MILETALRNILADAIDTEVNTGAGTATFVFETSGDVAVATINLQNPAFGNAVTGTITLQGTPLSDTNAAGGTIAQGSCYDRDGTKQWENTVGTSGTEIIITSTVVAATETVTKTSYSVAVPAS